MGVNFNPLSQQVDRTLINPKQQPERTTGAEYLSMTESIFTPPNIDKSGKNPPAPEHREAVEIPMDEFLEMNSLPFLNPDEIYAATTNFMRIGNKAVPTVDITYTPAEDGSVVTEHYSQGDHPKLLAKTTQLGDSITSVAYNQDGLATKTSTIEDGVTTIQTFDATGQRVTQETVISNDKSVTTNFDSQGNSLGSVEVKGAVTSEFSPDGTLTKKTVDKGNNLIYESTYSQNENGETVETTKNPIGGVAVTTKNAQGKSLEQTVTTQDGQSYSVKYDGNGNTKITVQNGETMAQIAQKFDCSVDDLKSMNKTYGSGNDAYFQAGQEIVVPGEIAAADERLISRDSKEVAEAKFTATQQEIEAKNRQIEQENQAIEDPVADNSAEIANREAKQKEAQKIARSLFNDMDGIGTSPELAEHMKMINSDNVVEVLNAYSIKSRGEGLIKALGGEFFGIEMAGENPADMISSALRERAQEAGVEHKRISNFIADFQNARSGWADADKMQVAIDILTGEIVAKENPAGEIASEEAIQTVASNWESNVVTATEVFNEAREMDSNIGKATDAVLGFFGCTSIDDMADKLNLDVEMAKKLTEASEKGDVESFKSVYREIFNRDFDPQLVASYDQVTSQYQLAKEYHNLSYEMSKMSSDYDQAFIRENFKNYDNQPYGEFNKKMAQANIKSDFANQLQSKLGISEEEYNMLLESNGGDFKTLLKNLQGGFKAMQKEVCGDKSIDEIYQEVEKMETAIFGGNDKIAEVAKFNRNQMITDIAGNIVVDVAVGAALSFIPGGVAVAGPKLAASAAKFTNMAMKAPKAVKMCNVISKSKAVKNLGKASKTLTEAVNRDLIREGILGWIHGEEKDSIKLFENSATNTAIKMGVNFLAKSLGVNLKLLENCIASALQVGAGTTTPEMAFFKTALGSTKLSPDQQKILAKHLNVNYERFIENA